jgi:DNA-binding transcriptional ArsR family regulator
LAIADLLAEYKRLSVTEIYSMLSIEQAIASHHLGILKDKGVLTAERKGKKIFYSLATSKIERILESLA